MKERRDSSAPVYKLPDDVLLEVFKEGAMMADGKIDVEFSFKVSHVVSRWRRVALSSPSLWTTLVLHLSIHGTSQATRHYVDLLLRRSAPLEVHVELQTPWFFCPRGAPYHELFLSPQSLYGPVFARCRSLLLRGQIPNFPNGSSRTAWTVAPLCLQNESGSPPYPCPLTKLEVVDFYLASARTFCDALRAMPSLHELSIADSSHNADGPPYHQVKLPQLTSLKLISTDDENDFDLLHVAELIRAPNIQHLHLQRPYLFEFSPSPLLRTFGLEEPCVSASDILRRLSFMPGLEIFRIGVTLQWDTVAGLSSHHEPLPALLEIEFYDSCSCWHRQTSNGGLTDPPCTCFDTFARFLLERAAASLKRVKFSPELEAFSEETKTWMRSRFSGAPLQRGISQVCPQSVANTQARPIEPIPEAESRLDRLTSRR